MRREYKEPGEKVQRIVVTTTAEHRRIISGEFPLSYATVHSPGK